jgi:RNA polymerase sigma-70 factor (ECF subfamily)
MVPVDAQARAAFVAVAGASDDATIAALADVLARIRAAWPGLAFDDVELADALGRRIAEATTPADALAELHAEDLALALACARGDAAAFRAFERTYASLMAEAATQLAGDGVAADEIVQAVREKLFGTRGDAKIGEFAGRGPLRKWLRVIVRRAGLDFVRARGRRVEVSDDRELVDDLRDGGLDVDYIKRSYGQVFQDAFVGALASLDARQRNVMRHHLVHGLTVEEIGGMYSVSRRTVTRWIAATRLHLLHELRERVRAELQIPEAELTSFLRDVRSRLEVSLGGVLRDGDGR